MQRPCLIAAIAVVAGLLGAAPAGAAFTQPELFVRAQTWDTHEPAGDWLPLASAPSLEYVGGYEVGYRLQDSGEPNQLQRVALRVAGVPDGRPSQPQNAEPYCVTRAGTAGTIVAAGPELQFEGDGPYAVTVSVGPSAGGASGCLSGPSTTAGFTVVARAVPFVVGSPMSFRSPARPSPAPFDGVRAADPPGGSADLRCALDAAVQPDGSLAGRAVAPDTNLDEAHPALGESWFPRPGAWSCVARAAAEGVDDGFGRRWFGGSWSAPVSFDVRSDFRRRSGRVDRRRARRPRFTFVAEHPAEAAGGKVTITLLRATGCDGLRLRFRRVARFRGRFGERSARLALRRPARRGYYLGRVSFGGTRFLRAGLDPNPMLLLATRRAFGYSRGFARCPGYSPPS